MLVLIAGATGNLGQHLLQSLLNRNHQVRALGRTPSKLPTTLSTRLESFITCENHYDIPALDRACEGVDAIICAYSGVAELQLEGQLLLLRAAERAGVKRFVAATWNYDWRKMQLGMHEGYDPYLSFRNQVELTSSIKPIYIFSGVMAEVLFSVPGHGGFSPKNHGVWDPEGKMMEVWGWGDEVWHWTTERDAAQFTVRILERDGAEEGGSWSVCSGMGTLREIARIYEEVRDTKVRVELKGGVDELREKALEARRNGERSRYWEYIGWFYQLYTLDGTWVLGDLDNEKLGVKTTGLEEFLKDNPEI